MDPLTEIERLLSQAEAGDRRAWEQLLAQNRELMRRAVEVRMDPRLQARLDVSDILQEAQVEATRRQQDFLTRRPMPFRVWLHLTAQECLQRLRRKHLGAQMRSVQLEQPLPDRSSVLLAGRLAGQLASPSQQLAAEETAEQVRTAVELLDVRDREILIMRTYEGLTNQEAAAILNIDAQASSKRYTRALIRLRSQLEAFGMTLSRWTES